MKRIKLEHHRAGHLSTGLDDDDDGINIKLEGVETSVYDDGEGEEEVQEYSVETVTDTL